MNTKQLAKFVSFVTTEKTLKNSTEIREIAGLPAALTELSAIIGQINALAETQQRLTRGKTARRNALMEEMRDVALEVANAVGAYADPQLLTEILPEVRVTATHFERLRIAERPLLALRIHAAGLRALPDHPAVPELEAKVEAVREALSLPREAIAERRAATSQLLVLFETTEALLARIDRMVYPLKRTSPQFYAKYLATRKAFGLSRSAAAIEAPSEPVVTPVATASEGAVQAHALAA